MDRVTLYEEYRLIEKTELEVNGIWKAAHLLLFFLAFVFGSFCTFCFHMMMYLFDEKCVLFPKLLSLTSFRQNIIYEFIPEDKEVADMLPVDFLSTQWVEKSACLLPTYVPLVSGIFGLVWTTMFLMCSTGSRVLTGLQRPWRVIPPVFLFSLTMGILCVYTSAVTHYGLQELCLKLSEITGSTTCTYTINVATLAYERRIRGVYQATRLTILSAWLHTGCWVLSTVLAVARIILAVDFQLVKVSVQLQGDIDRMLERHERHIRTVSPLTMEANSSVNRFLRTESLIQIHFKKQELKASFLRNSELSHVRSSKYDEGNLLYFSDITKEPSEPSLVQSERDKLNKIRAYNAVAAEHRFIVKMLFSLLDGIGVTQTPDIISTLSSMESISEMRPPIVRQFGQQHISSKLKILGSPVQIQDDEPVGIHEAEDISLEIKQDLQARFNRKFSDLKKNNNISPTDILLNQQSSMNITSEMKTNIEKKQDAKFVAMTSDTNEPGTSRGEKKNELKSNLKQVGIQTDEKLKEKSLKVQIDSRTSVFDSVTSTRVDKQSPKEDKDTQTKKEKMD
ncbi:uncharacterized protein LOC125071111 [Vanessa atalanta]|uniref:uncharacterized protein LOC125071111 n=1 Tax=Vanessa atalanta TaxID=42275 RepID=UPI001FCD72D5|nr:uncharacterized protein LOC125071111 [Vanessa atalanta]